MDRDHLITYLDEYLASPGQKDFGPNGLQVEGTADVARVITAVSACEELFVRAAERSADVVLVHHGIFWRGMAQTLTGMQYRRVKALIDANINLVAYHLPLDRHGEVGNNVLAARAFGLLDVTTFAPYEGADIGFCGRFPEPITAEDLVVRCTEIFGQEPLHLAGGPDPLVSLGIVSGGAQREVYQAIDQGLDAFITGEVSEWVMNVARECGIHYLAAGHYATERLGIRRLGEHLAEMFDLVVEFVDIPNPV